MLSWTQRLFYRSRIVAALLDKGGTSFEDWFGELAARRWGTDFEPVRAQGKHGDLKCDGRRISDGTIFQCYGPRKATERNVATKIKGDFEGALRIWQSKMQRWAIVINDREGLEAMAAVAVQTLRDTYPDIEIVVVGPYEIEALALELDPKSLADLCGASLDETDYQQWRLTYADITKVIEGFLVHADEIPAGNLTPPPADKISRNALDAEIGALLAKGNILTKTLETFFNRADQVELEARVAGLLSGAYREMKFAELDPSHIFYNLVDLAGGLARPAGEGHAVLGLITYFFNKCDIFEAEPAAIL